MVEAMQVLTRLSSEAAELPLSGYKNGGMHALVPSSSADPLNATLPHGVMPDTVCRRALNSNWRIISDATQ
ncbi:MAG: hypothetical protein ACE5I5_04140 [Candidatus Heimdallarchaeota archaeon]